MMNSSWNGPSTIGPDVKETILILFALWALSGLVDHAGFYLGSNGQVTSDTPNQVVFAPPRPPFDLVPPLTLSLRLLVLSLHMNRSLRRNQSLYGDGPDLGAQSKAPVGLET